MENIKIFELKKDVLAPEYQKKSNLYKLKRIREGERYFCDIEKNKENRIVILHKKMEIITEHKRKYYDCIRISREDLKRYFKEIKSK